MPELAKSTEETESSNQSSKMSNRLRQVVSINSKRILKAAKTHREAKQLWKIESDRGCASRQMRELMGVRGGELMADTECKFALDDAVHAAEGGKYT